MLIGKKEYKLIVRKENQFIQDNHWKYKNKTFWWSKNILYSIMLSVIPVHFWVWWMKSLTLSSNIGFIVSSNCAACLLVWHVLPKGQGKGPYTPLFLLGKGKSTSRLATEGLSSRRESQNNFQLVRLGYHPSGQFSWRVGGPLFCWMMTGSGGGVLGMPCVAWI